MNKNARLTTACALIFADFPLLYYGAIIVRDPVATVATLAILALGAALALTT